MKRRRALKNIGLATSTGVLLPHLLGACSEDDTPTDNIDFDGNVIIIGAGASGLYAASLLNQRGVNVTILEASDQIGGRVRSLRGFDDFPVELGADIVYGTNSVWSSIINDLNLGIVNPSENFPNKFIFENAVFRQEEFSTMPGFKASQSFVNNLASYDGVSQSIDQVVGEEEFALFSRILEGQIGNRYGSDLTSLGYRALAEMLNISTSGDEPQVLSGNPMQDVLFSRFNDVADLVQFETVVEQINYGGEQVTLLTSGGEFTADHVIVTVPISIIKNGNIAFNPPLPNSKTSAISKIGMDPAIKIFMRFNRNFWGDDIRYIYGGELIPSYINLGAGRSARNRILLAEAFGRDAEVFAGQTDASIVQQVVSELDTLFNGEATQNNSLTEFAVANWTDEQYIQGGYSYSKVGGSNEDRIELSESLNSKLYFAGEAANINGHSGTVQGALEAAEKSVEELVANITMS